jgi:hypothetical protein
LAMMTGFRSATITARFTVRSIAMTTSGQLCNYKHVSSELN